MVSDRRPRWVRKLVCFMLLHQWDRWTFAWSVGYEAGYRRTCLRCGKVEYE